MPNRMDINAMIRALIGDKAYARPVPDLPTYNMPQGFYGGVEPGEPGLGPTYRGGYNVPIPGGQLSVGGHYQRNPWGTNWSTRGGYRQEF